MLVHQNTLVSEDLFEKHFVCDLSVCLGACCIEGDAGAPLEEEELDTLDEIYPEVEPYLRKSSRKSIEKHGRFVQDEDGEWVTPLNQGKECAYTVFNDKGVAQCGIELANRDGKIDFQKPMSCHLYPIRLAKLSDYIALNYHRWPICSAACALGKKEEITIHQFLKQPLIRKFGTHWYEELDKIYGVWKESERF